jgi:hypothetical protein
LADIFELFLLQLPAGGDLFPEEMILDEYCYRDFLDVGIFLILLTNLSETIIVLPNLSSQ